jgi:hypothetical protein
MSTVVLPAAFPLVGLGLASTYFLTASLISYYWVTPTDDSVVPGKQGHESQEGCERQLPQHVRQ